MTIRRLAARAVAEIFSVRGSRKQTGLRILLYHSVGGRVSNLYGISVATAAFERQMQILSTMENIRIVKLESDQLATSDYQIAATFDDGYKDNLQVAAPILTKFNIPFTVFVTASFIGSGLDYLTARELRELAQLPGVTIGSHGLTHCRLADCNDEVLWRELAESRRLLQDMIGKNVTTISYPHGSVDSRVRDAADRAGYVTGATSRFGINRANQDRLRLHRCEIVSQDAPRVFMQKLNGHWDWRGTWR